MHPKQKQCETEQECEVSSYHFDWTLTLTLYLCCVIIFFGWTKMSSLYSKNGGTGLAIPIVLKGPVCEHQWVVNIFALLRQKYKNQGNGKGPADVDMPS